MTSKKLTNGRPLKILTLVNYSVYFFWRHNLSQPLLLASLTLFKEFYIQLIMFCRMLHIIRGVWKGVKGDKISLIGPSLNSITYLSFQHVAGNLDRQEGILQDSRYKHGINSRLLKYWLIHQSERWQWVVNYTSSKNFIIMFSYSFA